MADKEQDKPENQGLSGKLRKHLGGKDEDGRSFVSIAAGESLSRFFGYDHWDGEDKPKSNAFFVLPLAMALGGGIVGLGGGALYHVVGPGEDTALQPASIEQFSEGYYAAYTGSNDIYVLIKDGDHFRLYQEMRDGTLQMMVETSEVRKALSRVAEGFELKSQNDARAGGYMPITLEEIGEAYFESERRYDIPRRDMGDVRFHEVMDQQTPENYAKLAKVWGEAAEQAQTPAYGVTPEMMDDLSQDEGFGEGFSDGLTAGALSVLALWVFSSGAEGISTAQARTGRRRRKDKADDKNQKGAKKNVTPTPEEEAPKKAKTPEFLIS